MLIFGRGCWWEGVFRVHETGVQIDLKYCTASVNSLVLFVRKSVRVYAFREGNMNIKLTIKPFPFLFSLTNFLVGESGFILCMLYLRFYRYCIVNLPNKYNLQRC